MCEEFEHLYMRNLESRDDEVPEFLNKITEVREKL